MLITLTFFLLFPVQEKLPSAELVPSRKKILAFILSFPFLPKRTCCLRSRFHLELCNLCLFLFQVIMCFMCIWWCWRSKTALQRFERALPHRGPKNSIFLVECFHVCWIALNFVYLSQGWKSMGRSITVYFCSALKKNPTSLWSIAIAL